MSEEKQRDEEVKAWKEKWRKPEYKKSQYAHDLAWSVLITAVWIIGIILLAIFIR